MEDERRHHSKVWLVSTDGYQLKTEMLPPMIDRTQISLARLAKKRIRAPTIIRGSPTVTHPHAA